jgi:hypothetical protein
MMAWDTSAPPGMLCASLTVRQSKKFSVSQANNGREPAIPVEAAFRSCDTQRHQGGTDGDQPPKLREAAIR